MTVPLDYRKSHKNLGLRVAKTREPGTDYPGLVTSLISEKNSCFQMSRLTLAGLNIKVFEPLAHRASASSVSLARMQNLLAQNISDIQVIIYKMTHQKFR